MKKTILIFFALIAFHIVGFDGIDKGPELLNPGDIQVAFAADQIVPQAELDKKKDPSDDLISNSNLMILGLAVLMLVLVRGKTTNNF